MSILDLLSRSPLAKKLAAEAAAESLSERQKLVAELDQITADENAALPPPA